MIMSPEGLCPPCPAPTPPRALACAAPLPRMPGKTRPLPAPPPTEEITPMQPNMTAVTAFLVDLLKTPSPTGYHDEAMAFLAGALDGLALPGSLLAAHRQGALVATVIGADQRLPHRATAAHVDTLGAMVREVKPNGRLLLTQLGGYTWQSVEGRKSRSSASAMAAVTGAPSSPSIPACTPLPRPARGSARTRPWRCASTRASRRVRRPRPWASPSAISSPSTRAWRSPTPATSSRATWTTRPAWPPSTVPCWPCVMGPPARPPRATFLLQL